MKISFIALARKVEKGGEEFPMNLDDYWGLVASTKGNAKVALKSKVPDNRFFMTVHKKSGRGRAREIITTSLKAFETLMATNTRALGI